MLVKQRLPPLFYWLKVARALSAETKGDGLVLRLAKGATFASEARHLPEDLWDDRPLCLSSIVS